MTLVRGQRFGGGPALSAQVADALAELAKLAQGKPSLTVSCEVLGDMLPALFGEPLVETAPELSAARAVEKLAAGVPLLRGEKVTFDGRSLRRRWLALCKAAGREHSGARALADAFDPLDPGALLAEVLAGRPDAVHARAEELHLDAALAATVLRLTSLPALAEIAAAVEPLRRSGSWDHGACPTCGSWPLLGEFRGLEQTRMLRCGLCASEWQWARLRCPFCDERDHRQLGYLHVEGEETRYRAATCDACRGYVKMISTLSALSTPHLLVADLATLHLDLIAADRGFFVPAGSV